MSNAMTKWFYHNNQIVKGPFSTKELQEIIPTLPDPKKIFIWSRGYTEWISVDRWQPEASENLEKNRQTQFNTSEQTKTTEKNTTEQTVVPQFNLKSNPSVIEETHALDEITKTTAETTSVQEVTFIPNPSNVEKFRVQLNFVDQPQMTKEEIMVFASKVDDPSQIAIFDSQLQEWKEIYTFKEIIDKLGLTRRKHPRVPILAQFNGTSSRHSQFNARLVTISIGGLGLTDVYDLKVGDTISGQITSPHFYSPVTIEADVTYCGNDGYVGLKFSQINDDSQSLVTDYVKRFSKNM